MARVERNKCRYDESPDYCFSCPFKDCIREDIKDDDAIKDRYYKRKYIKEKKRTGMGIPASDILYQTMYRKQMSEAQKERYRAWQREYARKKRGVGNGTKDREDV